MFIWTMLTQSEGVCFDENNSVYISSEEFENIVDPMLYHFDFGDFITGENKTFASDNIKIYGQNGKVLVKSNTGEYISGNAAIYNQIGELLSYTQILESSSTAIEGNYPAGIYIVVFNSNKGKQLVRKVKM